MIAAHVSGSVNKKIGLEPVSAKRHENRMRGLVNFTVQAEGAVVRPKLAHLVIKLIAINSFAIDRVAAVNAKTKIARLNSRRRFRQQVG